MCPRQGRRFAQLGASATAEEGLAMRPMFMALVLSMHGAVVAQGGAPNEGQPGPTPAGQARAEAFFARIQDFQQRHSITVHGGDNPAAMSRGMLLSMFFTRFRSVDDASFAQFALEEVGATGADVDVLKQARNVPAAKPLGDACAILLEGSLADADGLEIANHIVAVEEAVDRDTAAPYLDIIDRLSPRVRANVLQGVDAMAVGLVSTNLDHLGMAHEDPDLYKAMTTGYCRGRRHAAANSSAVTNQDPLINQMR